MRDVIGVMSTPWIARYELKDSETVRRDWSCNDEVGELGERIVMKVTPTRVGGPTRPVPIP